MQTDLLSHFKTLEDPRIDRTKRYPLIRDKKRGDLSGVFVYKFKIHHQEFLLAYEWDTAHRLLLALGVHENVYRDLKNK